MHRYYLISSITFLFLIVPIHGETVSGHIICNGESYDAWPERDQGGY